MCVRRLQDGNTSQRKKSLIFFSRSKLNFEKTEWTEGSSETDIENNLLSTILTRARILGGNLNLARGVAMTQLANPSKQYIYNNKTSRVLQNENKKTKLVHRPLIPLHTTTTSLHSLCYYTLLSVCYKWRREKYIIDPLGIGIWVKRSRERWCFSSSISKG